MLNEQWFELMKKDYDRLKKQIADLKEELGGVCLYCSTKQELQFAHIKRTNLSGMSRGSWSRYKDVRDNKDSYILLCKTHHNKLDRGDEHLVSFVLFMCGVDVIEEGVVEKKNATNIVAPPF